MYCIPSEGEREQKRDRPFRRSEKSNKKDGERTTGGKKQAGDLFCTLGTRLVPFPQDGSMKDIQRYSGNRAKRWNNSQILFTAGMLESNVHRVKQQY